MEFMARNKEQIPNRKEDWNRRKICSFSSHSLSDGSGLQPMSREQSLENWMAGKGLVKISAIWLAVLTCWIIIVLLTTWCRKWWSLTDKCLVRGRVLWSVATWIQLLLSSKTRHMTLGWEVLRGNPRVFNSFKRLIMAMTSRRAVESAIYSASVVLNAMRGYILDAQTIGHPA